MYLMMNLDFKKKLQQNRAVSLIKPPSHACVCVCVCVCMQCVFVKYTITNWRFYLEFKYLFPYSINPSLWTMVTWKDQQTSAQKATLVFTKCSSTYPGNNSKDQSLRIFMFGKLAEIIKISGNLFFTFCP